jgi:inhibitor of cysteine peptidase
LATLIALLSLVVLLGQCSLALLGPPQTIRLTERESGGTYYLKPGDTLEIALPANPTTGYSWETVRLDTTLLAADGDPAFTADSDRIGAGGVMTCRFKAVGVGQTRLQLIYRRPFETDVSAVKVFAVAVVVR